MEEIKQYIITHWQTILEYAIMAIAYFLVFLYRSKINSTKRNLTVMFKEKTSEVKQARKVMNNELKEAKESYQKAVDEINILRSRLKCAEDALEELLSEEVSRNGK